ncbi:glycosyltransferase [Paracoccus sp. S4493]|uniref:glycosyltransferase n=1 Tax=Paracoccus sp. S4493 TaxID=579490 RepID=UPI000A060207|nr:glycosyltransferase [Paracoccus sp. S4493]
MINQISSLFNRYARRHAYAEYPGFSLLDSAGERFGYIDRITVREGRIWIDGWALSGLVGVANYEQAVECVPNITREDVATELGEVRFRTPGFMLEIPFSESHTVFWADIIGVRHMYTLPKMSTHNLKKTLFGAFLRDAIRVLPAILHWLVYRDARSAKRIKFALGLNAIPRSGRLNSLLFSDTATERDDGADAQVQSGITIVLPVYNAFELLPEVLERVLKYTDLPWRLIIVEDCSTDPQVRPWLRKWHGELESKVALQITVLENKSNLGFIRSVNRAFAAALPFGNHVVLLNSDAFVPESWASRLISPLLRYDDIATVTPMSNDAEIFNVPAICQRIDLLPGEADAIDRIASLFSASASIGDAPTGVGFCMAMHIDFLRKFPELDIHFGRGYGEEVDWCQRVRQKGGRHLGLGGLFVEHRGGTSFGSDEKMKLIRKNNQTIAKRYPNYDADVQDFIHVDPLGTSRLALGIAWAGIRQTSAVPVYLAHDMGGGAEHYLQNRLINDLNIGNAAIVLRVGGLSRWQIELHTNYGITRGESDDTDFIKNLLSTLPVRKIIYSCGVGDQDPISIPEFLISLARGQQDQIEVLIHDFLPLSPSYTLLSSDGSYHGLPMPDTDTDSAHIAERPDGTLVTLADWRSAWGRLLEYATAVIVFSENSGELVCRAYPQSKNKLQIIPHKLLSKVPVVKAGRSNDGIPVIGVLGNIGHQKGAAVLSKLSENLSMNKRAKIVVVGNIDPTYVLAPSAHVHGDYRVEDIPALVNRYGISRWLIPSVWPETFSYTTHEALATGLPVFAFNIGAQGDAVYAASLVSQKGGVIPLDAAVSDVDKIMDSIFVEPRCDGDYKLRLSTATGRAN